MTRRKLRRKQRRVGRARRERKYADNKELHAYEESIILPLVIERGSACAKLWAADEPERWRSRQLYKVLRRLEKQGKLRGASRSIGWRRYGVVFTPVTDQERKAA